MIPIERVWSVMRVYLRYVLHNVTIVRSEEYAKRILDLLVRMAIYCWCLPVLSEDARTL